MWTVGFIKPLTHEDTLSISGGSDYLLEDLPRAACIIKHGQAKEIVVNGVSYNQMMPANPISNLEIAEVLTYITNAWGNDKGLTGVKEVDKWLKDCEEY